MNEAPARVHMKALWVFEVGRKDALLILKALGGRLRVSDEDGLDEVADAKELCDRLTEMRAAEARQSLEHLERAASQARAYATN